jgi:pimeloyl-ACP methyl ester carboxylesterase
MEMTFVASADGTRIAYDRTGDGPAVVLVGGSFSYRKFPQTLKLAELLADQFTVYNYDRRGRGDSGDSPAYAVEREVEDLDAMIDAAGGAAHVFGLSAGGVLALEAASQVGAKVRTLAVYQPPLAVDASARRAPTDLESTVRRLVQDGKRGAAVKAFMTASFGMPGPMVDLFRLTPAWSKLTGLAHTIPYDLALLRDNLEGHPLPVERWSTITAPTLVLAGSKSPASAQATMRAVASALPNGRTRQVEGQAHNVAGKALAPPLSEFFIRQPWSAGRKDNASAESPTALPPLSPKGGGAAAQR